MPYVTQALAGISRVGGFRLAKLLDRIIPLVMAQLDGKTDDAGDAKRAKRGADERPPAPVEPRPGVGGSIGGDGEAAAVGMDGTGNRELGGVASE